MRKQIERWFNHKGLRRYGINTVWLLFEKGLRIALSVVAVGLTARYLGPETFGTLAYALSIVSLMMAFGTLGVEEPVIRDLVDPNADRMKILGSVFYLRLLGGVVGCCLVWIYLQSVETNASSALVTAIVILAIVFQSFSVFELFFQSQVRGKYSAIPGLIQQWISLSLKLYLIYVQAGLVWFAIAYVFDAAVLAYGLSVAFQKSGNRLSALKFDFSYSKALLFDFWPLMLGALLTAVYIRIDQVMIKSLLDMTHVGIYASAISLTEVWYVIPVIVCQSLFPAIVAARSNIDIYYRRLENLMSFLAIIAFGICIIFTFFSEFFVNSIFGTKYMLAVGALKISIWSTLFVFLGSVGSRWLIVENMAAESFYRVCVGIVVKASLNYLLIPVMGLNGAALATLFAHISASLIFDLSDRRSWIMFKIKMRALTFYGLPGYIRHFRSSKI